MNQPKTRKGKDGKTRKTAALQVTESARLARKLKAAGLLSDAELQAVLRKH